MFVLICWAAPHAIWAGEEKTGKISTGIDAGSNPLPDYHFVPGDTIELKFFYNPDMNEVEQIRPDGKITLPLIGDVALNGQTVASACRMIETLYLSHLKTPSVTIQIKNYGAQKVYVGGEVLRPGVVSLSSELTLLDALMEAGGIKNTGNASIVILIRKASSNAPQIQRIPLKGKDGQFTEHVINLRLLPYDVVLLPESKIARVDRWVDQYIRQVVPFAMSGGFSYLLNNGIYTK
jgi:protein involved in polysaccharide export with SLBB domain